LLPAERDIGSPDAFNLAKAWLKYCMENHSWCSPHGLDVPLLPTRVLDIGIGEGNMVRLHAAAPGERSQYIRLSYCWGKESFLRTTRSNLEMHPANINWSQLPQTFQDLIIAVRAFGIRYVWIDFASFRMTRKVLTGSGNPSAWQTTIRFLF